MIPMVKPNLNQKRKKLKEEKRNFDLDFMKINLLLTHQMQFICGNLKRPILILGSVVSITLDQNYPKLLKFLGTAIIIIGFAGFLYPLWPQQLRGGVYYLSWGGLGFVGFVIVLAIRKFFIVGHIRTLIRFVLTRNVDR